MVGGLWATKGAQKGWKYDPSNFNSNLGHFPGQMVENGDYEHSAAWIELSENQNFKKIGPGVPKIWAKKGGRKANFLENSHFFVLWGRLIDANDLKLGRKSTSNEWMTQTWVLVPEKRFLAWNMVHNSQFLAFRGGPNSTFRVFVRNWLIRFIWILLCY